MKLSLLGFRGLSLDEQGRVLQPFDFQRAMLENELSYCGRARFWLDEAKGAAFRDYW